MVEKLTLLERARDPDEIYFKDKQGRKAKFRITSCGGLEFYLDNSLKVNGIRDLRVAGNTVWFDGKRHRFQEFGASVRDSTGTVIQGILGLCARTREPVTTPMEQTRTFLHVRRAEGLRPADVAGKSDPYCVIKLIGKRFEKLETQVIHRSLNPEWDEHHEIQGYELGDTLEVSILDYDFGRQDDYIGSVFIKPSEVEGGVAEGFWNLVDDGRQPDKKVKGRLELRLDVTGGKLYSATVQSSQATVGGIAPSDGAGAGSRDKEADAPSPASQSTATPREATSDGDDLSRVEAIEELFLTFGGQDGLLPLEGLLAYSASCGYTGTIEEWAVHCAEISTIWGRDISAGIKLEHFIEIVDTKGGQGQWTGRDIAEFTQESTSGICAECSWRPVSETFQVLRDFVQQLRRSFADSVEAFGAFCPDGKNGVVDLEQFCASTKKLSYDCDGERVFRLLSQDTESITRKHFKWAWKLLDAERRVLDRMHHAATE